MGWQLYKQREISIRSDAVADSREKSTQVSAINYSKTVEQP